jgi:hypothetical protein
MTRASITLPGTTVAIPPLGLGTWAWGGTFRETPTLAHQEDTYFCAPPFWFFLFLLPVRP